MPNATTNTNENDIRVTILDSLLTCPHRDVENLVDLHSRMSEMDPIFYAHLGVWSQENTSIRDHKELFIARLFLSDFPEHREAAYVLMQDLPPYQIDNVVDHIKGRTVIAKTGKVYQKRFGHNLPRTFKSAVERYLRTREADRDWFDAAALRDRKSLKSLYCRCRIAPGNDHVRAVLFEEGIPEADSKFAKFKEISKEQDPTKQAEMIVECKIPFPIAIGLVKTITPAVFVALINNMTPQELLVNLKTLNERGAFNNPDLKKLIDEKVKLAGKSTKVDALKASQAVKNVKGLSETVQTEIKNITDKRLESFKITRPTALFIDKSGSMTQAIEVSKHIASLVSARCLANFYCYAFDRNAFKIECNSPNLSDWEQATKGIVANGGTAIGAPLLSMIRNEERVEQIIIVSDFDEQNAPYFVESFKAYAAKFATKPTVVMVKVGNCWPSRYEDFINKMKQERIEHDVYNIDQNKVDYYSLPNLLTFLTRKSKFEMVQEILEVALPKKENL